MTKRNTNTHKHCETVPHTRDHRFSQPHYIAISFNLTPEGHKCALYVAHVWRFIRLIVCVRAVKEQRKHGS